MDAPLPGRSYTRADLVGSGFATSLAHDLAQPVDPSTVWGTTRTLLWSILSLGLIPALWWPIKFNQRVADERRTYGRLADWLRAHCSHSESALLRNADEEFVSRPILFLLPLLICGAMIYWALAVHYNGQPPSITGLLSDTYWYSIGGRHHASLLRTISQDLRHHLTLFSTWNAALAAAYLCHWAQVRAHHADLTRYLSRVNRALKVEGLKPIQVTTKRPMSNVPWFLGLLCLWHISAAWGALAMLAGSAQKRYVTRTAPAVRESLSRAVGEMSLHGSSAALNMDRCPRERCRAPVRPGAHFCGRCGAVLQA